ncbi:hypothetical protein [Pseudomonas chlororaphis]|uniref:hypothetical protein n=2 Tax=Pseudomonas chlororaphis TaxID=587753 RepID=UPI0013DD8932|nr:hypothetical protein [Pseudomonas chlororaphis]
MIIETSAQNCRFYVALPLLRRDHLLHVWTQYLSRSVIMRSRVLANSTCSCAIQAPIERINLSEWLFTLSDEEYQACSAAHIAAGASRLPDGRRVSINVEKPGDTLMVQHYVEDIQRKARRGAWATSLVATTNSRST